MASLVSNKKQSSSERKRYLRENPIIFSEKILGHDLWDIPKKILTSISKPNSKVAIKACHSSSKCIPGHELVMLYDGTRVPAHELIGRHFRIISATSEGNVIRDAYASWNGIEQTIEITTSSGRRISRSLNHPLYVAQKDKKSGMAELLRWTPMEEIQAGDYVAVPINLDGLEQADKPTLEDWEIKLLAYNSGNLGIPGVGPFDPAVMNLALYEYARTVRDVGDEILPDPRGFSRGFPFEISFLEHKHESVQLLIDNDIEITSPMERRVPEVIYRQPYKEQQVFLSRLFTIGGYIDETDRYRISYYTPSRNMAEDVQHLLLVQGILSTVDKQNDMWRVHIDSVWMCIEFLKKIAIYAQEEKCVEALNWLEDFIEEKNIPRPGSHKPGFPHLHPGLMWELVTGVKLSGVCPTVALEVPDGNTFLGDFWEHNTHTCADAALWFVCTGGIVITTAPSWPQVERLLWGEIHRTYDRVGHLLGGTLLQTELKMPGGAYAFGLSTNEGVNFQGHHDRGGGVLVIIDEAPGVKPDIWEAIEGIRAGGDVRVLAPGNPVKSGGPFSEAFNDKNKTWDTYTISAFDTPNLEGVTKQMLLSMTDEELDDNIRSYLVTKRWVRDRLLEWGETDPRYMSRVLGMFPDKSSSDLLSKVWLEEAKDKPLQMDLSAHIQAGLDVAGEGSDETVLTIRKGSHILESQGWGDSDPRQEVNDLLSYWRNKDTLVVAVDSSGLGHYFVRYLIDEGYNVVPVNVSEKPIDDLIWIWGAEPSELPSRRFGNLKAQLYWGLRELFQNGQITGLNRCSPKMMDQLLTIRWIEDERNSKIYIESKKSLKKRGFDSPDHAESMMLAFASVGVDVPAIPLLQSATGGWGF